MYHVNPSTGNVNKCRATKNCPFGEKLHKNSKEEALALSEKRLAKEAHILSFYEPESEEELEFLLAYDVRDWGKEKLTTVDNVVFDEEANKILFIKRKNYPWRNQWALPGGFIDGEEDSAAAATRELVEETNLVLTSASENKGVLAGDQIDPRGELETQVFLSKVAHSSVNPQAGDDASEVIWLPVKDLPSLKNLKKLVPHHLKLVQLALAEALDKNVS